MRGCHPRASSPEIELAESPSGMTPASSVPAPARHHPRSPGSHESVAGHSPRYALRSTLAGRQALRAPASVGERPERASEATQ